MVTRRQHIRVIKWQEVPENRMYRSKKYGGVCSACVESCFSERPRKVSKISARKPFSMEKTMLQIILWHQVN